MGSGIYKYINTKRRLFFIFRKKSPQLYEFYLICKNIFDYYPCFLLQNKKSCIKCKIFWSLCLYGSPGCPAVAGESTCRCIGITATYCFWKTKNLTISCKIPLDQFMAPPVGFEPTTKWLTATYSTTELRRNILYI